MPHKMGKQCAKSDFHNNRLGLWLQMGRVKRVSWRHIVRGPARRGAPLGGYKGFGGAKTLSLIHILTKALRGQTEFTLGGDTYKRPKAGAPSELLAPWFQMKTISITHEEKLTEELFSRDVVDRIKTGYTFLLPYYAYFLTLPSDPEPETLK